MQPFNLDIDAIKKKNSSTIMLLNDALSIKLHIEKELESDKDFPEKVRISMVSDKEEAVKGISKYYSELLHSIENQIHQKGFIPEGAAYTIYSELEKNVSEHLNGIPSQHWMWIVAGPNGAGKSTFVNSEYGTMAGQLPLINPDIIAADINPANVEEAANKAGRIAISRMHDYLKSGQSFIVETTGAGNIYLKYANKAKQQGWNIGVVYIANEHPDVSIERVKMRVSQGGHDVPEEVIVRRWHGSRKNINKFLNLSDFAAIIDNTANCEDNKFNLVASGEQGKLVHIRKDNLKSLMQIVADSDHIISVKDLTEKIKQEHPEPLIEKISSKKRMLADEHFNNLRE